MHGTDSTARKLIEQFPSGDATVVDPQAGVDRLTEREVDVLVEMGRGRSDAEIGEARYVSETTVRTHVGRILTKLAVRDRVQAVVVAYESGIVGPGTGWAIWQPGQ